MSKIFKLIKIILEQYRYKNSKMNNNLFKNIYNIYNKKKKNKLGLKKYLLDYKPLNKYQIKKNWFLDNDNLYKFKFKNKIFYDGEVYANIKNSKDVIIFLPGYESQVNNVFNKINDNQYLNRFANELNVSLISWTWPFQGVRAKKSIYLDSGSNLNVEREYSRFFNYLNTSLWRELLFEYEFILKNIVKLLGKNKKIHIIGWSMGAAFSYYSSYFIKKNITSITSIGSCARFEDLIKSGHSKVQGFFFYPINAYKYFDLEDIIYDIINENKINLNIISGSEDRGCLKSSINFLNKNFQKNKKFKIIIFKNHKHYFSKKIKSFLFKILKDYKYNENN